MIALTDEQSSRRSDATARQAALHPPQKCIECGHTIAPEQMQCPRMGCGRARQGVQLTRAQIENLARFFQTYSMESADKIEAARRAHLERKHSGARPRRRGQFAAEGCLVTWADKVNVDPSTLRVRAKRLGSLRAAVEHYSPGAWK